MCNAFIIAGHVVCCIGWYLYFCKFFAPDNLTMITQLPLTQAPCKKFCSDSRGRWPTSAFREVQVSSAIFTWPTFAVRKAQVSSAISTGQEQRPLRSPASDEVTVVVRKTNLVLACRWAATVVQYGVQFIVTWAGKCVAGSRCARDEVE